VFSLRYGLKFKYYLDELRLQRVKWHASYAKQVSSLINIAINYLVIMIMIYIRFYN
jgi:hypothetical protein